MNADVYIGVGSNIAADDNIPRSFRRLMQSASVTGISIFYHSAPLHRPQQPPFTNGVVRIAWLGTATELKLDVLRVIESELGRRRGADRYADRQIDLDILLFGSQEICTDDLTVPDPELLKRPFLYIPLLELEPDLHVPGSGKLSRCLAGSLLPPALGLKPAVELTDRLHCMWRKSTGRRLYHT